MLTVDAVTLFLALLSVAAEAAVVGVVLILVLARWSPSAARAGDALRDSVGPQALWLGFVVAAVSMAGSLYFSEVANFVPCRLCWYQRIAMYPLVPILGIAAWRRDLGVRPYAVALAAVGAVIAAYHVLLERFPTLESSVCEPANPCTLIWVRRFGYLTIPTMALSAFALVLTLLAIAGRSPAVSDERAASTSRGVSDESPVT